MDKYGVWLTSRWTADGRFSYSGLPHSFDLIPIIPQPLEGKKVGDKVYAVSHEGRIIEWEVFIDRSSYLWISNEGRKLSIDYNGIAFCLGNGQQLFFATKEEARKSIEEGK